LATESPPGPHSAARSQARRYALRLEYDGTSYNGWQIQSHAPSIQQALNSALSTVADAPTTCTGAGRTDAGVHATAQVVHFDSRAERSPRSWLLGLNSNLPADINVHWVVPVPPDFHARYSALSRSYRYVILNRAVRSALRRHRAWWIREPLDTSRMMDAAVPLRGEHDFSAFRAAACQARTPWRDLHQLEIRPSGDEILIDCEANAFLHHMVRNIVGSLVAVGKGDEAPAWIGRLLERGDRRLSGMTAPACGLFLTGVRYPAELQLPATTG